MREDFVFYNTGVEVHGFRAPCMARLHGPCREELKHNEALPYKVSSFHVSPISDTIHSFSPNQNSSLSMYSAPDKIRA